MISSRTLTALALAGAVVLSGSCKSLDELTPDERIPLDDDLRNYARDARTNMSRLPASYQAAIEPILARHERALADYDRVMAQGQTRRNWQTPLVATGATLFFDNATGVGVVNDIALPFLALGIVAVNLTTKPPASRQVRLRAHAEVVDSADSVSEVIKATSAYMVSQEVTSVPGDRQFCIDMYVACQLDGRRRFPRSHCHPCMDQCKGQGYEWPDTDGCKFW